MQRTAPCLRRLAVRLQSAPGGLWPAQPWSLQAARAGHVIEAEIINSQEEYAAKNIQKLVKLDKLDKSCAKNEKRVTPSFQRLIDNAYTRKRLQKRRFEAYLKVIEDRKQQGY